MKNIILITIGLLFSIIISSCNNDIINDPIFSTGKGIYILSEGGSTPGSSKLSYYNNVKDSFYTNIYKPGTLGLYADGLIKHNFNFYITAQGNYNSAGRLYKCDINGNLIKDRQAGINAYSLTISNDKIYVTNGPYNNITIFDLDLGFIKNMDAGIYPQEIISNDNYVFIANTGIYGGDQDSTITVIKSSTDEFVKNIFTGKNLSSLAIMGDKLIAGMSGTNTSAKISIISLSNLTVTNSYTPLYGFSKDISVDENNNTIYYLSSSGDVVSYNFKNNIETKVITAPLLSNIYGYGYDSINKMHYLLDAKTFLSDGKFYIYNENGQLQKSFDAGIAPRRILIYN